MEMWKYAVIIIIIGFALNQYEPDLYDKSYGKAIDWAKGVTAKGLVEEQNQDTVNPDGTVVSPDSGTNFGRPYDLNYYNCNHDANCHEFSIYAKCNNETGECFIE